MQHGKKLKVTAPFTIVFFPLIKTVNFERNDIQASWSTNFMNALRKHFLALSSNSKSYAALITIEVVGNLMCFPSHHFLQNRSG